VNQVEIFFSIVNRRCLRHGDFRSEEDLKSRLLAFIEYWNHSEGHPFRWTFRGYPMQEATA
jgi:putative transposase